MILAGDFNSAADGTGTTSYAQLVRELTDAWPKVHPNDPGFTCCTDLKTCGTEVKDGQVYVALSAPAATGS